VSVALLVNGLQPTDRAHALGIDDRGLQYGDGVFETALLARGRIRFLEDHLLRLEAGCLRLGFACPERAVLLKDLGVLTAGRGEGILKITVTRGVGGRGYRPPDKPTPTRILALYPLVDPTPPPGTGIVVRWCETRLGRNPGLAGIKHLNRLEHVLAQAEWRDPDIAEGLMLDTEGEVVAATSGNVFIVREGTLCTPDLRYCGIRGVMRGRVLGAARSIGLSVEEQPLWRSDIDAASELFITNAVRGIRPVIALEGAAWPVGDVTIRLATTLALW
jgi:4-amino-4-deoxychorismate lyase